MGNFYYRADKRYPDLGQQSIHVTLLDFIKKVAPKRPQYRFLFTSPRVCLVYLHEVDITGEDRKSANYLGSVEVYGLTRRGGVGPRHQLRCQAGNSVLKTVVLDKLVKFFMDELKGDDLSVLARERAYQIRKQLALRISNLKEGVLEKLFSSIGAMKPRMLVVDPCTSMYKTTESVYEKEEVKKFVNNLQDHGETFGYDLEFLTCVTVLKDTYLVCDDYNATRFHVVQTYTRDTLPTHLALAIGMLKIADQPYTLFPEYGMMIDPTSYAVKKPKV